MSYRIRNVTGTDVAEVAAWRYAGAFATYDPSDPIAADDGFVIVEDEGGGLVGYACFGAEARVPGITTVDGVLDVAYGMAPDLTGQGRGRAFVGAILDHGRTAFAPERFRAVVYDWNEPSLAALRTAGFDATGEVTTGNGRFLILERPA